ncbi:glycosyltransferase family 4 protein [Ectothiorhodospira variabilis]|uniref:glycosyltransferase family 4 protein n=1 Tax=Ectothiorhodospira variabilis TaxID=505694 RepID=UPI001EFAC220|nr:glycosyltransferase family 4 protein [Ectothiorhodospira variabilis]MCG5496580.1 glycosyltransferase [Ectothiorhodospira variabilis]
MKQALMRISGRLSRFLRALRQLPRLQHRVHEVEIELVRLRAQTDQFSATAQRLVVAETSLKVLNEQVCRLERRVEPRRQRRRLHVLEARLAQDRQRQDHSLHERLDRLEAALGASREGEGAFGRLVTLPTPAHSPVPSIPADQANIHLACHPYTLLCVAPIRPDGAQHLLIDTLYALGVSGERNLRLIMASPAGAEAEAPDDPHYQRFVLRHARRLGVAPSVRLLTELDDQSLASCFQQADLLISLSETPPKDSAGALNPQLVRALQRDMLALVHWPSTPDAGPAPLPTACLLPMASPAAAAAAIGLLLRSPAQRHRHWSAQREHFARPPASAPMRLRLEGPFDSSYSLAVVNRELARALDQRGDQVALHHTDGCGDTPPDPAFLAAEPALRALCERDLPQVDVTLRNCYPPRTQAMSGVHRLMGPYGWEESGFPAEWIEGFNRRLTGMLCMSDYVRQVLLDNGLTIPACTTGLVVDHILREPESDPGITLPPEPRLLHVSSCFPRKGIDLLLPVFAECDAAASLVIKTFPNPHNQLHAYLHSMGYTRRDKQAGLFNYCKGARCVQVIESEFTLGQMRWLYGQCHALAAPSRGEGFGLPMAEAMLLGLPVVTTDKGGQADFCTPETAWLVSSRPVPATSHFNLPGSQWWEPDVQDLHRAVKQVLADCPEKRAARVHAGQVRVEMRYSASKVRDRVRKLLETPGRRSEVR